jgi:hypothetical protein
VEIEADRGLDDPLRVKGGCDAPIRVGDLAALKRAQRGHLWPHTFPQVDPAWMHRPHGEHTAGSRFRLPGRKSEERPAAIFAGALLEQTLSHSVSDQRRHAAVVGNPAIEGGLSRTRPRAGLGKVVLGFACVA